ncbi:RNA polymerase sigma factor [Snuella sedimenti]|uniref:Sigma-70 family RNA polymerase sigma factor n=1 Tax=Snuella sedimenti TaxID=2798802 RepID=A0A8J7LQ38_9FLAO|nr:sigma-70 family RNA polymerase sigma factor [Snuella sedimenti]MBJ6369609.1 sigma-70 family RNA polymerase sigma factor [Snuella sedimenti]
MSKKENITIIFWENLRKGQVNALEGLYDLFIDDLFAYGMKQVNVKGYVMDCIHDLFVDLYKYRSNLSETDNVKFYLFKSLKRKINKRYSGEKALIDGDISDMSYPFNQNYTEPWEKEIINEEFVNEKKVWLSNALGKLSKKQQRIVFLRYNEDKTYEEIAKIMGVSVATARTKVYRVIKKLRESSFSLFWFFKIF